MSPDQLTVLGVLLVALVLFVTEALAVDLVALLVMSTLVITGVLTSDQALAGFSNSALLTVGAMFVISAGLIRTGALDWITRTIAVVSRGGRRRQVGLLMLTVAVISAFMNNTPVAIIFLPVVLSMAARLEIAPSKLMIPLSFATILGGTCTLIGTSTNLLVAQFAEKHGFPQIGIFDFAIPGALYAAVGLGFMGLFAWRLLPTRASISGGTDAGKLREFVTEITFPPGSPLVGRSFQEIGKAVPGITPLMLIRGEETFTAPLIANPRTQFVRAGDVLLLRGDPGAINALLGRDGVTLAPELGAALAAQGVGKAVTMIEIVIAPTSPLIGRTLGGAQFSRRHGNASVLAILRGEEHLRERVAETRLRFGDTLLVVTDASNLDALRQSEDFLVLEGVEKQVVHRDKGPMAVSILVSLVLLAAFNVLPISILSLAAATAMIVTGCLPLRLAYNSLDLSVLVLIAGMLALAEGFDKTGLVHMAADGVVAELQPFGPRAVMAGIFLLAALITNFASNNAVAVLLTPIALEVARTLHFAPAPFLYAVLFGASCAFATPIGYQTNLFVYGPGNYRFRDYLIIGVPMTLALFVFAVFMIPWFWPFVPVTP